jgi:hypothetical protein
LLVLGSRLAVSSASEIGVAPMVGKVRALLISVLQPTPSGVLKGRTTWTAWS